MKKIPSVFVRDFDGDPSRVLDEVTPGCEWVLDGEGIATRKWDGAASLVRGGEIYRRYDCKRGKTPPLGFEPCEPERDEKTGHWPGWVKADAGPESKWFRLGLAFDPTVEDGTYELVGPKVGGNPEGREDHVLIPHGRAIVDPTVRTFEAIREYLMDQEIEGIVWHHPDGRMAKIKRRDFGLDWPVK